MADAVYTAHAEVTGGREGGHARTDDGELDVRIERPGSGGGTNPEQLFAAGYAACFLSALKSVARKHDVDVRDASVHADVDLVKGDAGFGLAAALRVTIPGVEHDRVQEVVEAAHQVCPYSKATRGNIEVRLSATDEVTA